MSKNPKDRLNQVTSHLILYYVYATLVLYLYMMPSNEGLEKKKGRKNKQSYHHLLIWSCSKKEKEKSNHKYSPSVIRRKIMNIYKRGAGSLVVAVYIYMCVCVVVWLYGCMYLCVHVWKGRHVGCTKKK
jgi:hypothetical protein